MKLRFATFATLLWVSTMSLFAQMTFTLKGGITFSDVAERDGKGFTTVTLPAGTDLSELITAVQVDGVDVSPSTVTPNPTTTTINYDELKVFTYNNKAYGFRFVEDVWFCAVFISDCHVNQGSGHDGTSAADLTNIMNNIIAMGKDGTKKVNFTTDGATNLVPKTSIIFCLGDIDQDKANDSNDGKHTTFLNATAEVAKTAGIPFIFIAGNHDFSPDYWTGSDGDAGVTSGSTGGANADAQTISAITDNNSYWNTVGVFDENITYFTSGNNYGFEPNHFTFKFKDVRFYCANNYWFQKPYKKPGWLSGATYYAPDPIVSNLNTFVEAHADEASVWMQHYPWLAGSDCDRWWLDQNDVGKYATSSNTSIYGSSTSGIAYNDATSANTLKKDPLSAIMAKTAGKVDGKVQHFSGHYHRFYDATYTSTVASDNKVHDYTVAANGNTAQTNNAFVVLFKRGEGVKEVIQTQF
ncbi:MAG: metallophosphoesterase [Bacteroidaceae bacterium]|nr:metallophosphoesterase [Bacteroidaceae bacterium]